MRRLKGFRIKNTRGITLLALIITIIILLIIAGISIVGLTGENGLIKNAGQAKQGTEIANEKEILERATVQSMAQDSRGNIKKENLENKLDEEAGEGKTEVIENEENLVVKFEESNRYYEIDKNGNVSEPIKTIEDEYAGDLTKGEKCDGSKEKPFKINCIEDLVTFSIMNNGGDEKLEIDSFDFKDSYVILTRSLDFKSIFSYNDYKTTKYGDLNKDGITDNIKTELIKNNENCIGFTPIGINKTYSFSGVFLGNGFEINNIYENSETVAGLFGYIENATISDLGISGNLISKKGSAGGIVAVNYAYYGTVDIKNCYNKCNITAEHVSEYEGVGGIVGGGNSTSSNLNIINCYNEGKISLNQVSSYNPAVGAGGIVGSFRSRNILNIYNSYNIGEIVSVSNAAGILGGTWAEGTLNLTNCCNYGEITGDDVYNIINTLRYYGSGEVTNLTNCYYLENNKEGKDSEYVTSFNKEQSSNIVNKLNEYKNENINDINNPTKEWYDWKIGENSYPIFDKKN